MTTPLKALLVQDNADDSNLIVQELRRAGFAPDVQIANVEADLRKYLSANLDAILIDISAAQLDGLAALALAQDAQPDIPVIMIADPAAEAQAFEALQRGASDYVFKDRLMRLGPAITHALTERRLRRDNQRAHAALRSSEERLSLALEGANDGIWDWNIQTGETYYSPRWETMLGYEPGEVERHISVWERLVHPDDMAYVIGVLNAHLQGKTPYYEAEHRLRTKSGDWIWVLDRGKVVSRDADGTPLRAVGTHVDITARKQTEATLAHLNSVLMAVRNVNQLITQVRTRGELLQPACDILIETRGYNHAWIVLLDADHQPQAFVMSGADDLSPPFAERFKQGNLPVCVQRALEHTDVVVTRTPVAECGECLLAPEYTDCGAMTMRLQYRERVFGVLTVSLPASFIDDEREIDLFQEVANDIGYALHNLEMEAARRQNERQLQAAYQWLETIIENMQVLVAILDPDLNFVRVNRAFAQASQRQPDDFPGVHFFDLPVDCHVESDFRGVFQTGEPVVTQASPCHFLRAHERGTTYWDWALVPIKDDGGTVTALLATFLDVTERVEAESALRAQRDQMQSYLDIIGVLLVVLNPSGTVRLINRKGCEVLGYSEDGIVDQDWFENFLPPAQRQQVRDVFAKVMQDNADPPEYYENELLTRDGTTRLIAWRNTVLRDEHGKVVAALSSGEDITERRAAEIARREEHEFATALSDITAVINSTLDFDTVIDRILKTVGRVLPHDSANLMLIEDGHVRVIGHLGYRERGLVNWIESLYWSLDDVPNLKEQAQTAQSRVVSDVHAYEGWYTEPETRWIRSFASAPIVLDDRVIGFLNLDKGEANFYTQDHAEQLQSFANQASVAIKNAQLYDMVQRHAAELERSVAERTTELRESEARYRAIVEDQTELISRFLPDGTLTFVNQAVARFLDKDRDELIGHALLPYLHEADRTTMMEQISALTPENPVVVLENRLVRESGEERWLQWTNRMITDEDGQFIEYQSVGRDITERRQAEEVLRKSLMREIELGELKSRFVSLVSHEFRNPLAVILMNSDMLRRYHERLTPEQRDEYLNAIRNHVRGMTDLLEDLLLLSQSEAGKLEVRPQDVNLGVLGQRIVDDVRTVSGEDRFFDYNTSGECTATTDPKLFRLILSNLVSNAAKYSLPGGYIEISLSCEAQRVVLRVSDEGIGIPQAEQAQLFDPFTRASNVGRRSGTGLGLTLVKQCVELMGGTIAFQSQENIGTTFTVTLPRVTQGTPKHHSS